MGVYARQALAAASLRNRGGDAVVATASPNRGTVFDYSIGTSPDAMARIPGNIITVDQRTLYEYVLNGTPLAEGTNHRPEDVRRVLRTLAGSDQLQDSGVYTRYMQINGLNGIDAAVMRDQLIGKKPAKITNFSVVSQHIVPFRHTDAACSPQFDHDPQFIADHIDTFFPERGGSLRVPRELCLGCTAIKDCLEFAVSNGQKQGLWGGLSARERKQLLIVQGDIAEEEDGDDDLAEKIVSALQADTTVIPEAANSPNELPEATVLPKPALRSEGLTYAYDRWRMHAKKLKMALAIDLADLESEMAEVAEPAI